jgi:hypothetical protein
MQETTLIPQTSTSRFRLSPSLFKYGFLVQTMVGFAVSAIAITILVSTIVVSIVRGTYQPPVLANDFVQTYKSNYVDIHVLENDYDIKGSTLVLFKVIQPLWGQVSFLDSNTLRYFPMNLQTRAPHYAGFLNFTYFAKNDKLASQAVVVVRVLNHPPEAVHLRTRIGKNSKDFHFEVFKMKTESGMQIKDIDMDILHVSRILNYENLIGNASISHDNQSIVFTGFPNSTKTEIIQYEISDGNDTAITTLTVDFYNDPPEAMPDIFVGNQNQIAKDLDLLKNDVDKNNDPLKIISVKNSGLGRVEIVKDGKFVNYIPSKGVYADSFEYTISDGEFTSSSYAVITMINNPPFTKNYTINIPKNSPNSEIPLYYSDKDPFTTLNVKKLGKSKGNVQFNSNSTMIVSQFLSGVDSLIQWENKTWNLFYQPLKGESYQEKILFALYDGLDSIYGEISVNVINNAPVAMPDVILAPLKSTSLHNLLINDYDTNGDLIKLHSVQNPSNFGGRVRIINETTIEYQSPPKSSFDFVDYFSYSIDDSPSNSEQILISKNALVIVYVKNIAPEARDDVYSIKNIGNFSLNVLENDFDINNDTIRILDFDRYSKGGIPLSLLRNEDGMLDRINYPSKSSDIHVDYFTYSITDGSLNSSKATVKLIIENSNPINEAPICLSFEKHVNKSQGYTWNLLQEGFVKDPNEDNLSIFMSESNLKEKSNVIAFGNIVKFQSKPQRSGFISLKYFVSDGLLNSTLCEISIHICNKPPTALDDQYQFFIKENTEYLLNPLMNDFDMDGDHLKIISTSSPGNVKFLLSNESILYKPPSTISPSVVKIGYCLQDDDIDNPMRGNATITVKFVNPRPMVIDDIIYTDQNTNLIFEINDLLKNDESGDPFQHVVFSHLVDCELLDKSMYCSKEPLLNNPNVGYITVPYVFNSCKENRFQYCIYTSGNKNATSCGTVTVRYKNCICKQPVDIALVIDSSGSISNQQWNLQIDFCLNITKKLTISPSDVNVAVIQFGEEVKEISPLTSTKTSIQKSIENVRFHHMASWTNTLGAINQAVVTLKAGDASSKLNRDSVPKVVVLLTDGLSNRPCNCTECLCESSFCLKIKEKCDWNPQRGSFCQPCADPSQRAKEINAWRKSKGNNADWKIIAIGIGEELHYYQEKGIKMIREINYNRDSILQTPWNQLDQVVSQIVDQSCNF